MNPAKPIVTTRGGHTYTTRTATFNGRPGEVRFRDGRVSHIHTGNLDVHRGIRGDRRIERFDSRGGRVVVVGRGRGFYERAYFNRGTHRYIQRTYVWGGRRYAFAYRSYAWGGVRYYRYAPAFYYRPAFYGWAYRPWVTPVYFSWGWGPAPWYGFYGYYFAPAPFYPTPSLWVTDYVLAANLQQSYDAQAQDGPPGPPPAASGAVVLSPEVKQAIALEVQARIQAEQQAASQPQNPNPQDSDNVPPPALSEKVFVVAAPLDVTNTNGTECHLSPGDVLYRTSDPAANDTAVNVLVKTSQRNDCAMNSVAAVQVTDLQEMQNQLDQQVDAALQKLATDQGKNGLPPAPDQSVAQSPGEVPQPAPDNTASNQLQDAQNDADQAEQQAGQPNSPANPN